MNQPPVSRKVRRHVFHEANYRCGYCLTSQRIVGPLLELEHLTPLALGGTHDEENLWVACPLCNGSKSDRVEAVDPETQAIVPLFNPRIDIWKTHFAWNDNGTFVVGLTPTGRATVALLKMNQPDIVLTRQLWVMVGWHPPVDSL